MISTNDFLIKHEPAYAEGQKKKFLVDDIGKASLINDPSTYGPELLGTLSTTPGPTAPMGSAPCSAVGEKVSLDKDTSDEDAQKASYTIKDAMRFLYQEIQSLQSQIEEKRNSNEDISNEIASLTEKCNEYVQMRTRHIQAVSALESGMVSNSMYDIFLGQFSESVHSNMEEVLEYVMDKNTYRVQEAFRIYESVYRDDKRVRFTPKQNLEFHKLAMERRDEVGALLKAQNNDIRVCTAFCENARATGDLNTLGVIIGNLKAMEMARDSIDEIYGALTFSRIQEATPDQVSYLRENAITVKLKTFRDIIRTKTSEPNNAELMKNKEWSSAYKKWCELQNQQDELIKEREKLYSINHKKPSDTTTNAIARLNSKIGSVMKQISELDEKIDNIETQLMKQNCMSKSYWKRRIDQCQAKIDNNEKTIEQEEKHLEFIEKMLGNSQVQSNPDTAKAIGLEKQAIQLKIDVLKRSINKSKMNIIKWKGIAKNAPNKTVVKGGKITDVATESVTMGERLDKIVDNFVNRQLRVDDDFKELDDKLWREKAELNSLNRKAVRLTERDESTEKILKEIMDKEKEVKEIRIKWETRLDEIAPYLPYSYWKKLCEKYTKQIVWNTDMADSFDESIKDAKEELASIESGWKQGSAALMRANIRFYQERSDHYKHEAKTLMRLQKDAEERMRKAPNKNEL